MYLSDVFTLPVNIAGIPALTLPCGFADGLPVGLQLMADRFREDLLLRAGFAYEQATTWRLQRPNL
jgi:aspartyl-tRNA(Asn)/glutamyl-tRNA(Gln) amidotransferase subunit A